MPAAWAALIVTISASEADLERFTRVEIRLPGVPRPTFNAPNVVPVKLSV